MVGRRPPSWNPGRRPAGGPATDLVVRFPGFVSIPPWERASRREGTGDGSVPLSDVHAMGLALAEAEAATAHGDVPVGAVALVAGAVVASRHNEREKRGDPTAHAEMLALADAAAALGTWRLSEVTLVVTLEPCPMCAGALVASRLAESSSGRPIPRREPAAACTTCAPTPG